MPGAVSGLCDWCGKARTYLNHAACSPEGEAAWERGLELDELDDHEPRRSTTVSTPTKYRKKPVVIEAMCWDGKSDSRAEIARWVTSGGGATTYTCSDTDRCAENEGDVPHYFRVVTLEGAMNVSLGDYVIRGVQGEFYPCKPDIFAATYGVEEAATDTSTISDGYHTFAELYEYRMLYNAHAAKAWDAMGKAVKSWRHSDGEECFGGGWFVVVVDLHPHGQVSNHYPAADWDLFHVPEVDRAPEWDGHTPADAAARLRAALATTKENR